MLLNDFENQGDNQKCILAISSTDPEVIKMVGKFVNAIFSLRECIYFYVQILSEYMFQDFYACSHICQVVYH